MKSVFGLQSQQNLWVICITLCLSKDPRIQSYTDFVDFEAKTS